MGLELGIDLVSCKSHVRHGRGVHDEHNSPCSMLPLDVIIQRYETSGSYQQERADDNIRPVEHGF